jgi:hypothetical protein
MHFIFVFSFFRALFLSCDEHNIEIVFTLVISNYNNGIGINYDMVRDIISNCSFCFIWYTVWIIRNGCEMVTTHHVDWTLNKMQVTHLNDFYFIFNASIRQQVCCVTTGRTVILKILLAF